MDKRRQHCDNIIKLRIAQWAFDIFLWAINMNQDEYYYDVYLDIKNFTDALKYNYCVGIDNRNISHKAIYEVISGGMGEEK